MKEVGTTPFLLMEMHRQLTEEQQNDMVQHFMRSTSTTDMSFISSIYEHYEILQELGAG